MGNSLSLYTIEDGLAELLDAREQARADLEEANRRPQDAIGIAEASHALQVVEVTLQDYISLEVRKVDNYHRYLTTAAAVAAQIREEEKAIAARRRRLEAAISWLKQKAVDAMAIAAKKHVDGSNGRYLLRKGNGGVRPLIVDGWDPDKEQWLLDPAPLPDQYVDVTFTVPRPLYMQFLADCANRDTPIETVERIKVRGTAPAAAVIRVALEENCPGCHGAGAGKPRQDYPCCDGTGTRLVPGARLGDRGEHLEVK